VNKLLTADYTYKW